MPNTTQGTAPALDRANLLWLSEVLSGLAGRPAIEPELGTELRRVSDYLLAETDGTALRLIGIAPGPDAPPPPDLADLLLLIDSGDGSPPYWDWGYWDGDKWCLVGEDYPLGAAERVLRWYALPETKV
jgi:hypothetical protein